MVRCIGLAPTSFNEANSSAVSRTLRRAKRGSGFSFAMRFNMTKDLSQSTRDVSKQPGNWRKRKPRMGNWPANAAQRYFQNDGVTGPPRRKANARAYSELRFWRSSRNPALQLSRSHRGKIGTQECAGQLLVCAARSKPSASSLRNWDNRVVLTPPVRRL